MWLINYFKKMWHYHGSHLILITLLLFFSGFLEGFAIILLVPVLDIISQSENLNNNGIYQYVNNFLSWFNLTPTIELLLSLIIIFIILSTIIILIKEKVILVTGEAFTKFLKDRLYHQIVFAPWHFIISLRKSELVSLLNTHAHRAGHSYIILTSLFATIILSFIYLIMSLLVSMHLTVMILGVALISYIIMYKRLKKGHAFGEEANDIYKEFQKILVEYLDAMNLIKATGSEKFTENEFKRITNEVLKYEVKAGFNTRIISTLQQPIMIISLCCVLYISVNFLDIRFSNTLVILALFSRLTPKLMQLQQLIYSLSVVAPALKVVEQLGEDIDKVKQIDNDHTPKKTFSGKVEHRIIINNIYYRYPNTNHDVLENISFKIDNKQIVGFTGPSGGGKSTCIQIIVGLLNPDKGEVLLDNYNLKTYDIQSWTSKIGYVAQDSMLMHDSIQNNIRWGRPIDLNKIKEAATLAHANDFIAELNGQYDCVVGDRGGRLSGGQRQRIMLARALAGNPALLILDEATNALDAKSEFQIQKAIDTIKQTIPIIMVSHKASSLKQCDYIYVIDHGKITGEGTWRDLNQNTAFIQDVKKYQET